MEYRKLTDYAEINALVLKIDKAIRELAFEETKEIDRKQAWLIVARALNSNYQNFFGWAMIKSIEHTDTNQKIFNGAPSEQGNTDGK